MQHSSLSRHSLLVALSLLLSGCMVVPRTNISYNAECGTIERRIVLEAQQVGQLGSCKTNMDCAGLLALYGLVASTSVVVSGTVAVVGNVAYWVERQAQCPKPATV